MNKRIRLGFAFLGGALGWTLHLISSYAIGESTCVLDGTLFMFLGMNAAGLSLAAVTLIALAFALAAMVLSATYALRTETYGERDFRFVGRAGVIANALFLLVILAQASPILFLLNGC